MKVEGMLKEIFPAILLPFNKNLDIVEGADIVFDNLVHQYTMDAFKVVKEGETVISLNAPIDKIVAKKFQINIIVRFIISILKR